jgi:hypothetical protein
MPPGAVTESERERDHMRKNADEWGSGTRCREGEEKRRARAEMRTRKKKNK